MKREVSREDPSRRYFLVKRCAIKVQVLSRTIDNFQLPTPYGCTPSEVSCTAARWLGNIG
jgi:hypothetical protein